VIQAGFAVADITPPVGAHIPGGLLPRVSVGIRDPLQVTAGVFLSPDAEVALVGVDAVSLKTEDVVAARACAQEVCGIPADNIIVAASHTHSGGPSNDVLGVDSDPHYRQHIVGQIASAVAHARVNAVPAHVGWTVGEAEGLAWNRRWVMRDGSHETHADPANPDVVERAGPSDPAVALLCARDLDGNHLGCVANFTCHVTIMGGDEFSADYPGAWRDSLARVTGAPLVFLNGAMGDITQVNKESDLPQKGDEGVQRFGLALAGESMKLLADMRFHEDAPIAVAGELLQIEMREPSPAQLEEDRAVLAAAAGNLESSEAVWARERVLLREYIDEHGTAACEVKCLRVGNLGIASCAGQMFCVFGLATKERSPFEVTMFVSLANGNVGYVPTAEAIAKGGYEPTLCRGSRLVPDAGERIVESAVRLLEELA